MDQQPLRDTSNGDIVHSGTPKQRVIRWKAPGVDDVTSGKNEEAKGHVITYLTRLGYIQKGSKDEDKDRPISSTLSTALKDLQDFAGLETTGVYDEATAALMNQPRCGFPDKFAEQEKPEVGEFVLAGTKWDHTNITFRFDSFTADISQVDTRQAIRNALNRWAAVTPLSFAEITASGAGADIRIRFVSGDHGDGSPFDGVGNILAHAFYPPPNGGDIAGDAHFDDAETWNFNFLMEVALHELGHAIGLKHSTVNDAVMWPFFAPKSELHEDDLAGIHSIYGWRNPRWLELDNNPATASILASGSELYQIHDTGKIWHYTGPAFTGWQAIDANPATVQIVASGGTLYQRHNTGKIWRYTGPPITGWQLLDGNPACVDIAAGSTELYQRHFNGNLFRYTGTAWEAIDGNPQTVQIVAAGTHVYQRHGSGNIWRYRGSPSLGWELLDNNPRTVDICAGGDQFYQRHSDGTIWRYTGPPLTGWQMVDNNPATVGIFASGTHLYQIHGTGLIWRYTGTPLTGWENLDSFAGTKQIVGGEAGSVFQRRADGQIWRLAS